MSEKPSEIRDDEIRIILRNSDTPVQRRRRVPYLYLVLAAILLAVGIGFAAWMIWGGDEVDETAEPSIEQTTTLSETTVAEAETYPAYTVRTDTVVNGVGLTIYTPHNAMPLLVIGDQALADSAAVLVAQAADVRGDNGTIAGAYVVKGELVSKGEAKAGFCSIVNGDITVGVADATPMLEQALASEGYFFRQYPLVVGGQLIENKPKGRAMRKALAEIDGRIHVVSSADRLTFHEFSQALVDVGVRNAIYLVGSSSAGFYVDEQGRRTDFISTPPASFENINFIVWR